MSPSMRREWIEIQSTLDLSGDSLSLPPCGGSGLKYSIFRLADLNMESPSMRREWIEML